MIKGTKKELRLPEIRPPTKRKFGGKVFYSYMWFGTKALATTRAKGLRSLGYNIRVVKVNMKGQGGYLICTSGSKKRK